MGRPTKKTEATEVKATVEATSQPKTAQKTEPEIPAQVVALMRLYPQYEELWITPKGFVHPTGTPEYLIKGATLYKNKFYNN